MDFSEISQQDLDRFWRLVSTAEINDCWLWRGAKSGSYGRFRYRGAAVSAHAFALAISVPKPADKPHCCHDCDTPLCCNPAHLYWGTPAQNNRDKHSRGRTARGERVGSCKLTDEQRREIVENWRPHFTYTEVAREYGVRPNSIKRILRLVNMA